MSEVIDYRSSIGINLEYDADKNPVYGVGYRPYNGSYRQLIDGLPNRLEAERYLKLFVAVYNIARQDIARGMESVVNDLKKPYEVY